MVGDDSHGSAEYSALHVGLRDAASVVVLAAAHVFIPPHQVAAHAGAEAEAWARGLVRRPQAARLALAAQCGPGAWVLVAGGEVGYVVAWGFRVDDRVLDERAASQTPTRHRVVQVAVPMCGGGEQGEQQ